MGEIFKKHIFGDGKKEFTNSDLPKTRRKQFVKLISNRIGKILTINLFVFIFALPLIAWDILTLTYASSFGDLQIIDNLNAYITFINTYKLPIRIALSVIAFMGICGGTYTIRRLTWSEPVSVFYDIKKGIRLSYKQFIVIGIMYAIFAYLFELAFLLLKYNAIFNNTQLILIYALLFLAIVILASILMYVITLASIYISSLFTIIKTSLILTLKYFIKNLGIIVLTLIPTAIWFLFDTIYFNFIGYIILGFCGFSYVGLIWVLYTHSVYDIHINLKQYPNYFRKGLSKEDNMVK